MSLATPPRPQSPRQVILGLFIVGQLAFLLLSNLLGFVQWFNSTYVAEWGPLVQRVAPRFAEEKGHGWQWCEQLEKPMRTWTQLTLQDQAWSLFAPNPGTETGFPGLLLSDKADDSGRHNWTHLFDAQIGHHVLAPEPTSDVVLLSDNEPADIREFFRMGTYRVRRYEGTMYITTRRSTVKNEPGQVPEERLETPDELAQRLTRRTHKLASDYRESTLAYMKWRLKAWRQAHPDEKMPAQVILFQRSYRIHQLDEPPGWDGPFVVPILRWRPQAGQADANVVLDSYDFMQHRFVPVN